MVVLDTNVLLSAIIFNGNLATIIDSAIEKRITLATSEELLAEFSGVLVKKFGRTPQEVAQVETFVRSVASIVRPRQTIQKISSCPADNRVLECAVTAHAEFLVTGDKRHLLPLRKFRGVRIVTPAEFLAVLDALKT